MRQRGLILTHRLPFVLQKKRITIAEALRHPYMASLHNPDDEPDAEEVFDFSFEDVPLTKASLQKMIFDEVAHFHPEIAVEEAERAARGGSGASGDTKAKK